MADVLNAEQRHKNMVAIHSKDTNPEKYFRKLLFSRGYRYRIAEKRITGHPDIFLRKYNTAVFIHGCFWHRHKGCTYCSTPKSNSDFWAKKFQNNVKRDQEVRTQLKDQRVKCLVIWECTLKKMKKDETYREEVLQKTMSFFDSNDLYLEI